MHFCVNIVAIVLYTVVYWFVIMRHCLAYFTYYSVVATALDLT